MILAGGYGKRLWPISKQNHPKQFIQIFGGKSLFQLTLQRNQFLGVTPSVIVGAEHYILAAEQIKEVGIDTDIIIEPVSRNTAPCAIVSAIIAAEESCDIVLLVPSDHYIENHEEYITSIEKMIRTTSNKNIVALGIKPESPHTGYGYIKTNCEIAKSIYKVEKFIEKPGLEKAQEYIKESDYYWNIGIYAFSSNLMKFLAKSLEPEMFYHVVSAMKNMEYRMDYSKLDEESYRSIIANSIDYAFIQKLSNIVMVEADFQWKDIGCFKALFDIYGKDDGCNVICGDAELFDTSDSYIHSDGRFTAVIGLKDLIVVNVPEASLIIHKSRSGDINKILENLSFRKANELKLTSDI